MARLGLGSSEMQQREPGVFRTAGSNPFSRALAGAGGPASGQGAIQRTELPAASGGAGNPLGTGAAGSDALAQQPAPDEESFGSLFLRSLPALLTGPGGFAAALIGNMQAAEARGARFAIGQGEKELVRLVDQGIDPMQAVAQVVRGQSQDLVTGDGVKDLIDIARGLAAQPEIKAPATRKVRMGAEEVAQEFDAASGQWREVGRGAAFAPREAGPTVNVNMPAPMQENIWTERGLERVTELDQDLGQAQRVMSDLDAAEQAIKAGAHTEVAGPKIGFTTPLGHIGVDLGTDFLVSLMQVGRAVGVVDAERMSQTELLQSITAKMAPMMRPVGSGSTSDKDMELFLSAVPSLAKSAKGNLLIIDLMRKGVRHKQQQLGLLEEMIEGGTYTPSKFSRAVSELGRPFSEDELETLEIVAQGKPQPLAAAPKNQVREKATKAPEKLTVEDIGRMTPREVMLTDVSKLTPAQRAALVNRMSQLGM